MSEHFDRTVSEVINLEGGYVNDPQDSGGETNYGVTAAVARANGYTAPMRELPLYVAKRIYKSQYWDTLRLDEIAALSAPIAHKMFDIAVNCGVGVAGAFLQRSLAALNDAATAYGELKVDGVVGPITVYALHSYIESRRASGEANLLKALNGQQAVRYIEIVEKRPKDRRFINGWFNNRVG